MSDTELQQLATLVNRPLNSLQAFNALADDQLATLRQAVDEACARQRQDLDAAFRRALPAPLRWLVLRILRGSAP